MHDTISLPTFSDVQAAAERISAHIHHTPIMCSRLLNDATGRQLFFKCENLQRAGAFKFRGAYNSVTQLSDIQKKSGVAAHSSGNHAGALALAAQVHGIKAYLVMPENSVRAKIDAVRSYGAEVIFCAPHQEARETKLAEVLKKTGAFFIPPYDAFNTIAGAGTVGLELLEQVAAPPFSTALDAIIAPVGGGGLLAGCVLSGRGFKRPVAVFGAEPTGADDAQQSLEAGHIIPSVAPNTIADGLRTSLGERNFAILNGADGVAGILTATDDHTRTAMRSIFEYMKIVVEPSAALPLAVLLSGVLPTEYIRVGIVLSGGNIDLPVLC